jgi:hypothetical protein
VSGNPHAGSPKMGPTTARMRNDLGSGTQPEPMQRAVAVPSRSRRAANWPSIPATSAATSTGCSSCRVGRIVTWRPSPTASRVGSRTTTCDRVEPTAFGELVQHLVAQRGDTVAVANSLECGVNDNAVMVDAPALHPDHFAAARARSRCTASRRLRNWQCRGRRRLADEPIEFARQADRARLR